MKITVIFGAVALLAFNSCAKDEKQLMRSWIVESVKVDGADSSAMWTKYQYIETYGDGGVYSFSGDPTNSKGEGDYQWSGGNKIKRSGVSKQPSVELTVVKLTRKEFVYTYSLNSKNYEFSFKKY